MKLIFSYLSKVLVILFITLSYLLPAQSRAGVSINQKEYISVHHNSHGENLFSDFLLDISVDDDDVRDSESRSLPVRDAAFTDLRDVLLNYSDSYIHRSRSSEFLIQHHLSLYIFHCVFRL